MQDRFIAQEQILNGKIREIEDIWAEKKPSNGALMPSVALDVLNVVAQLLASVKDEYRLCCRAKELLGLEPGNPERLEHLEEDIVALKEGWSELETAWRFV